jgi:hypothetical protein
MKRAALAAYVSAFYLAALGIILVIAPNLVLPLFGFLPTTEVWIRVVGTLTASFSWYTFVAARTYDVAYLRASLVQRLSLFITFLALVLLGQAQPILMLFGSIEVLAAVWTSLALAKDSQAASSPGG